MTDGRYLLWMHNLGNAHCHGGFRYNDGELVVPREGMYRVFLQITYECSTSPEDVSTLKHQVLLFHQQYINGRSLLRSVHTLGCTGERWTTSLHTDGLFHLPANSTLRVKSSHAHLITKNEDCVFFGAELRPH